MSRLVYNAIRTPDGTVLESYHRHDFQSHKDANGHTYIVDGGLDYIRRNINIEHPSEDLSLLEDDPQEQVGKVVKWGTYGINGDQPLKWVSLRDMSVEHLKACTTNLPSMVTGVLACMIREIEWREAEKLMAD